MTASSYFSKQDKKEIIKAITEAELNTSGEIRVHIDLRCKGEVLDRASLIFKKLRMHKTALRNGVLIYVAVDSKKFAILGDKGISEAVPSHFWEETKEKMNSSFSEGNLVEGILIGIRESGQKLKSLFPYQTDDKNELSNEISFED